MQVSPIVVSSVVHDGVDKVCLRLNSDDRYRGSTYVQALMYPDATLDLIENLAFFLRKKYKIEITPIVKDIPDES